MQNYFYMLWILGLSMSLVVENIPSTCELSTLMDIMCSYGKVADCNFNKSQGTANVV